MKSQCIAILLCLFTAACQSNGNIRGSDQGDLLGNLRLQFPVKKTPDNAITPEGIELDFSYRNGSTPQHLGAGSTQTVGGAVFSGPTTVDADYGLLMGSAAVRMPIGKPLGCSFESILGLGFDSLNLSLDSGAQKGDDNAFHAGILYGLRISYPVADWLHPYGEVRAYSAFSKTSNVQGELGALISPGRTMQTFVAWRWSEYQSSGLGSGVDLTASGPVIGLQFTF